MIVPPGVTSAIIQCMIFLGNAWNFMSWFHEKNSSMLEIKDTNAVFISLHKREEEPSFFVRQIEWFLDGGVKAH